MTCLLPSSLLRPLRALAGAVVAVASLAGCCAGGKCIKDPPCACGEDPCCLTPVQRAAREAKSVAMPGNTAYTFQEKTYILFTKKGDEDFRKDPEAFEEKGAVRVIRKGKTYRTDIRMKSEEEPDWATLAARAVPYTPPPPKPK